MQTKHRVTIQRHRDMRIEHKLEFLDRFNTSEQLFDHLKDQIDILSQDQHSYNLCVNDDYNFGTEYDIEILLELISDLRSYTNYKNVDDYESIEKFELSYLTKFDVS